MNLWLSKDIRKQLLPEGAATTIAQQDFGHSSWTPLRSPRLAEIDNAPRSPNGSIVVDGREIKRRNWSWSRTGLIKSHEGELMFLTAPAHRSDPHSTTTTTTTSYRPSRDVTVPPSQPPLDVSYAPSDVPRLDPSQPQRPGDVTHPGGTRSEPVTSRSSGSSRSGRSQSGRRRDSDAGSEDPRSRRAANLTSESESDCRRRGQPIRTQVLRSLAAPRDVDSDSDPDARAGGGPAGRGGPEGGVSGRSAAGRGQGRSRSGGGGGAGRTVVKLSPLNGWETPLHPSTYSPAKKGGAESSYLETLAHFRVAQLLRDRKFGLESIST